MKPDDALQRAIEDAAATLHAKHPGKDIRVDATCYGICGPNGFERALTRWYVRIGRVNAEGESLKEAIDLAGSKVGA